MRRQVSIALIFFCLSIILNFNTVKASDYPDVNVKSAILMDYTTGRILFEKQKDTKLPIASTTKLMTYLVAMDRLKEMKVDLNQKIKINIGPQAKDAAGINLKNGEEWTLRELFEAMLVISANDCAEAIAIYTGGSFQGFVDMMNKKAEEVGMKNTHFLNPTGMPDRDGMPDKGHYSTAEDMALLTKYILLNYPEIIKTTSKKEISIPRKKISDRKSSNKLLFDTIGVDGLKTGFTIEAGYCLVSTADITKTNSLGPDFRLISVVLGAENHEARFEESKKLLEYGMDNYIVGPIVREGETIASLFVKNGKNQNLSLQAANSIFSLQKKYSWNLREKEIITDEKVSAPVKSGQELGKAIYIQKDTGEKYEVKLIAASDVEKAGIFELIYREIGGAVKNIKDKLFPEF